MRHEVFSQSMAVVAACFAVQAVFRPLSAARVVRPAPHAGQTVGIKQTDDRIWLVSFVDYDLGYFDEQTCRLGPLANPFGPKVLPMSSE
jgi:hypothetical protein